MYPPAFSLESKGSINNWEWINQSPVIIIPQEIIMCFPLAIMTQSPCSNLVLNRDFYLYTREKFFQDLCWGGTLQGLERYQHKEINIGKTAAKCQNLSGSPRDSFASLCPMRSYDFSPTRTTLTSGFLISLPISAYVSAKASFQCSDPRLLECDICCFHFWHFDLCMCG